jgi:hypothetical protein
MVKKWKEPITRNSILIALGLVVVVLCRWSTEEAPTPMGPSVPAHPESPLPAATASTFYIVACFITNSQFIVIFLTTCSIHVAVKHAQLCLGFHRYPKAASIVAFALPAVPGSVAARCKSNDSKQSPYRYRNHIVNHSIMISLPPVASISSSFPPSRSPCRFATTPKRRPSPPALLHLE